MLKLPRHLAFKLLLVSTVVIASFTACGSSSNSSKQEKTEMERFEQATQRAQEKGNFLQCLNLAKRYYEVSRQGHSDVFQIAAASNYGQILTLMGKVNEAKPLLDQALSTAIQLNNDSLLVNIYNGLAFYETIANSNDFAAIEYLFKALEKLPKNEILSRMALLNNLSYSLTFVRDTTARYAIELYELSKEQGNYYKSLGMFRMAQVYFYRKQFQQAKELLEKAYEVALPPMLPEMDHLMVDILIATHQFEEASRYADHAIAVADTCKDVQPAIRKTASISKAGLLSKIGKYEESNQLLDIIMADSMDLISARKWEIINLYTFNHEHLGHYKETMEYSKQLNELTVTQANQDRVKILKAKEVALDVAQKDAEIEKQKDKADALQKMLIGTLVFTLLLIGLGISIFIMYRKKHQLMKIIVDRAETHEKKQKEKQKEKQQQADERNAELFQRIQQLVETQQLFKDPGLSRESLSALLSTSHTYISEAVRQVTGKSFPQYICDLRQQEAERMLHDSTCDTSSLKMLYVQVGFTSSSAFYKSFKKATGMSPSSYLRIIQEERQEHH